MSLNTDAVTKVESSFLHKEEFNAGLLDRS